MFRGDAEVQVSHLAVPLVDEVTEQQVQGPQLTSLLPCCDILDMCHLRGDKHQTPRHDLTVMTYQKELDLLWETRHQQLHLLHTMHGRHAMVARQHIREQHPILLQRRPVLLRHAVDIQTVVDGFTGTTQT